MVSEKILSTRAVVERTIRHIKVFKISVGPVPRQLQPYVFKLFFVISHLTNMEPCRVKAWRHNFEALAVEDRFRRLALKEGRNWLLFEMNLFALLINPWTLKAFKKIGATSLLGNHESKYLNNLDNIYDFKCNCLTMKWLYRNDLDWNWYSVITGSVSVIFIVVSCHSTSPYKMFTLDHWKSGNQSLHRLKDESTKTSIG